MKNRFVFFRCYSRSFAQFAARSWFSFAPSAYFAVKLDFKNFFVDRCGFSGTSVPTELSGLLQAGFTMWLHALRLGICNANQVHRMAAEALNVSKGAVER